MVEVKFDMVDFYVDMTFGLLIAVGIASMMLFTEYLAAVTFGVGVLLAYAVHFAWRMARFDPETKQEIEDTVTETVEETVEETVGEMQEDVEEKVEETVGEMQEDVESRVEETIEEVSNE